MIYKLPLVRASGTQPIEHYVPVKLRPKMSSSAGSSALGVVVFVIVSFDGSSPAIFVPTDASA